MIDYIKLSKLVSHALRHEPEKYGLILEDGWVDIESLLTALRDAYSELREVRLSDLEGMIVSSEKKRHEIHVGKIRALYGHSFSDKIVKPVSSPPTELFHGTTEDSIKKIMTEGLLPMKRQYVHLSEDRQTASKVAMRRKGKIKILTVKASQAYSEGVNFYKEEGGIWLADFVPIKYLFD